MSRPHIAMRKIREVLRLTFGEELSLRLVGASLQIPPTTVADYVRRAKAANLTWPIPEGSSDNALDAMLFPTRQHVASDERPMPDWAKIHAELPRPHVTMMLLWHEYRELYPDGYGYSQFCAHYLCFAKTIDVVMRQEHKAGERLFVDLPGGKLPIYDVYRREVTSEAELFVAAMGASGLIYAEITPPQELIWWINAHVRAFVHIPLISDTESGVFGHLSMGVLTLCEECHAVPLSHLLLSLLWCAGA
ncbi:MAG: hypothetical protein ACP5O0_09475 [Acidimicrobiales bacterium]